MQRYLKYGFLLVPVVVALAMGWHVNRTGQKIAPPTEVTPPAEEAMVTGIRMVQNDGERTEWSLAATKAEKGEPEWTLVRDPVLILYQEDGGEVRVTSREGAVHDHDRRMRFSRNILISDSEGRSLATEELRFDPEQRELTSEAWFLMSGEGMRLEGTGLRLDQKSKRLEVRRKVKVMFFNGFSGKGQP